VLEGPLGGVWECRVNVSVRSGGAAASAGIVLVADCRRVSAATVACISDVPAAATSVRGLSPGVLVVAATSAAAVIIIAVPCQHVDDERVAAVRSTPAAAVVDAAGAAAAAASVSVVSDVYQSRAAEGASAAAADVVGAVCSSSVSAAAPARIMTNHLLPVEGVGPDKYSVTSGPRGTAVIAAAGAAASGAIADHQVHAAGAG
jgi:hypothetical protein